jgi:hypothetical protein
MKVVPRPHDLFVDKLNAASLRLRDRRVDIECLSLDLANAVRMKNWLDKAIECLMDRGNDNVDERNRSDGDQS